MEIQEYGKLHSLESHYWWHRGRRKMILALLDSVLPRDSDGMSIADVGCGTGSLLSALADRGQVLGLDYSPVALGICRRQGLQRLVRADAASMPVACGQFDLLTALDVVEHIEDETKLLSEFHRILRPGGRVLITVPAHPGLWSAHDLALHHYRRYTRSGLLKAVTGAGLVVDRMTYGMLLPLIPALGWRMMLRRWRSPVPGPPQSGEDVSERARGYHTDETPVPGWLNGLLLGVLSAEAWWMRRGPVPAGLSLMCVARKP